MIASHQFGSLLHLGVSGIGHDAGKLHDVLIRALQNTAHLIVDAVTLDGAAAIGQQYIGAVMADHAAQILLYTALSKDGLRGIFKNKVVHVRSPSLISCGFPKM